MEGELEAIADEVPLRWERKQAFEALAATTARRTSGEGFTNLLRSSQLPPSRPWFDRGGR